MEQPKYKRVILKLSGEALSGEVGYGLEGNVLNSMALQVKELVDAGVEVAIVVGGGNIWRGVAGAKRGIDRATADYMGMLATVINALALQDAIEAIGLESRVMTSIEMREVAEPYIKRRATRHLEKGRVVIFGAGTGNPYFSTDTGVVLRAIEVEADVILLAKAVDGVYDDDPRTNPAAKKFETLAISEIVDKKLGVIDLTSAVLCLENKMPLLIFSLNEENSIVEAALGKSNGTVIIV